MCKCARVCMHTACVCVYVCVSVSTTGQCRTRLAGASSTPASEYVCKFFYTCVCV